MTRKVGKRIGGCIYVHRLYQKEVIPADLLKTALGITDCWGECRGMPYNVVKWNKKTNTLTFFASHEFDEIEEPSTGFSARVRTDRKFTPRRQNQDNPQIWHHKWMFVKDSYTGFDVDSSKARSKLWEPHVAKEEKSKIGFKQYWDSIRHRWE